MKIFISSTFEDLKGYRAAVRDAILRLRQHPIGMEDFGSQPEEWNKAALGELEGCGALVGIYAHRYGSIPPGDTLSIAEQEFDKARALNIPCFCYRLDPQYSWPPEFTDTGDMKRKLDAFLKKVDQLLRSKFTTPDDLAKQIAADLGRWLATQNVSASNEAKPDIQTSDQSGGVNISGGMTTVQGDIVGRDKITQIIQSAAPAVQALHSLPPPPADFTGRAAEVDQLLKRLGEGTGAAISGLSGMGGVGKTALALVVADKLADRYSDAQIFLDLRGTADLPLASADAMAQVIHAFQPQADLRQIPESELPALYRSVLSDKPALLLLDNARDAAQVKPLLPPPTCSVIVTSRRHFVLPGLQPLRLDVLKPDDARDLLLTICPRLEAHASRLAELCGCLPLALRIAASHLGARVDLSPSDYIAQLKTHRLAHLVSEDDPDQNVERVFDLSYGQLAPEMQGRFRALAVFPAPFDALAPAAIWALEPDLGRDVLGELLRYSLVEYDGPTSPSRGESSSEGRYHLHDLVREFADARITSDERYAAEFRHAQYYLQFARAANDLYLKGGGNVLAALALFDAEFAHIRAGQAWSALLASTDDGAARLCDPYPSAAANILDLRLHARELTNWLESALAAARKLGNKQAEEANLGNLGSAYLALGEVRKALSYYEQALTIAREIGDRPGEGASVANFGHTYYSLGEVRKAIEYNEQALAIHREIGDRKGEASGLGNLGNVYCDLGEVRKAIDHYEQALAIDREIGDRKGEASGLGNLGIAYDDLGEYLKAIDYYEQALAIDREIGDRRGEGNHLGNLGNAYYDMGEVRKAIDHYEQALAIARDIGDRPGEGTDLGNLGLAYAVLGEVRQAIEYYKEALSIHRATGSRKGEGSCLCNLGLAYVHLGEVRKAIDYYEQALAIHRTIGDRHGEATDLLNLSFAYRNLDDLRAAITCAESALKIFEAIESPKAEGARQLLERLRQKPGPS